MENTGPLYLPSVLTFRGSQVLGVALLQGTHCVQSCLGPAHQVVCKYREEAGDLSPLPPASQE